MTKSVLLPNCICFNGIHVTSPEKAQISHGVHEVLSLGLGEGAQGIDGHTTLRILSDQCFFGTRGPMRAVGLMWLLPPEKSSPIGMGSGLRDDPITKGYSNM